MMTKRDCAQWLRQHDHYLILTHRRPDGDTLGSAAFLCRMLRSLGKTAQILRNPEITPKYAPLHEGLTKDAADTRDILICVDVASKNMLPDGCLPLLSRIALRIDHHGSAASFTPLELVEPDAGACAEILYDIALELGAALDKPMAQALYTAVSTDTGCFRYANTTAHSFRTAAACADTGADLHSLNQLYFDTNTLAKLRLQGWMAENTRIFASGKLAVCALPKAVEEALGVDEDDMDNISGFPRSIEGIQMAATLRETGSNQVKLSVRAVPGYDAAAVCARFGGGGHKGAAGGNLAMPLEAAASAVAQAMEEVCK